MKALIALFSISILFISCKKEGLGGKSEILGTVTHHSDVIPESQVYIKYGEEEFPGPSPELYDDSTSADINGEFTFNELRKGNYYLYSTGYDPQVLANVKGGIKIKLVKNGVKLNAIVPVTEGD